MYNNDRNIYKIARKARGITQEKAAEKLGISVESIRAYENGMRTPPDEVVDLMVICYDSQLLGLQHLRSSAEMARSIIPEVRSMDLPVAAMRLINRIYQFADNHRDRALMRITEDGIIDQDERKEFDAITVELEDIIQAALELRCSKPADQSQL